MDEDVICEIEDDFSYQIKERGKYYYDSGKVLKVVKSGDTYYAKVQGSRSTPYNVVIHNRMFDGVEYECDCPYEFPCKHEYAVIKAISCRQYEEIELKPKIYEKKFSLTEFIKKIPASELKNYILSDDGLNYVCLEIKHFEDYFSKYLPKQKYEFYYNNLYNELLLNTDDRYLDNYLRKIKKYLDHHEFAEGYKILKSIIEAYHDTDQLGNDSFVDTFPKIGMFLRVIFRKSDSMTKDTIMKWVNKLSDNNYYNSYYLEDVIDSMKGN